MVLGFHIFVSFLLLTSGCAPKISRLSQASPTIRIKHHQKIITVKLEDYVSAVLAGEVSESWPMETLKAQAIAARTFAIRRMKERKNQAFHTQSSVMDQVFKKHNSQKLKDAALETKGLVLLYDKGLAETSFHSTCGGHTTSAQSVWGRDYPYLRGVSCQYCSASPAYTWRQRFSSKDLQDKFKCKLDNIKIIDKNSEGRAQKIALSGSPPQTMSGPKFRTQIGNMKLKSTWLTSIKNDGSTWEFTGKGFGHGVGLCQYGALGMAKEGKTMRDILYYYYPGTKIAKLY